MYSIYIQCNALYLVFVHITDATTISFFFDKQKASEYWLERQLERIHVIRYNIHEFDIWVRFFPSLFVKTEQTKRKSINLLLSFRRLSNNCFVFDMKSCTIAIINQAPPEEL